jgi:hypothetical protein
MNESWLRGEFGYIHSHTIFTKTSFYHVLFQYLKATASSASQFRIFTMLSLQTIKELDTDGAGVFSSGIMLVLSFVKIVHLIQKYKLGDERQRADFKSIPLNCAGDKQS